MHQTAEEASARGGRHDRFRTLTGRGAGLCHQLLHRPAGLGQHQDGAVDAAGDEHPGRRPREQPDVGGPLAQAPRRHGSSSEG